MVVCGTLFMLMRKYEEKWGSVRKIESRFYFAKTADFVEKTGGMSTLEAEELIRERAKVFLEEKDYLLERW